MFSRTGSRVHRVLVLLLGGLAISLPLLPTPLVARSEALSPELPRVFLDTTLVAPSGQIIAVPAGGDVQAALNAAQPGDVITLQAGATFTGPFTLPNKTGAGWITVRTSAPDSSLPAPGTRVTPSYAAVMPKIVVGGDPAIGAAAGAHHFRFIGIEVKPLSGAMNFRLVELGSGSDTTTATLPHDIIIDRCYIHGNAGQAAIRGVALNGSRLAVIDSYLAEFKDQGADTQALMGWNGPGPFKIVNNYLEAAGENVMFGGADPSIVNLVPADIEIRGNHFFKPTAWRGVWAAVKNLFELKNARRVLIEGNIFENNWLAAQAGWAVQFTVRNQDGTAPWSTIEDVTFQKNVVRHSGSGLNILAADDPNPSQTMKRVLVRDNLFDDISGTTWGGSGRLFQILGYAGGSTDLVIEHNSGFQQENVNYSEGVPHLGFIYRNNITPRGAAGFGFIGQGAAEGISTLTIYFPLAVFQRNVIAGGNAAIYPADDFFPSSLAAVGFVDLAGRNYRLAATSPYKNAGTDGTDIGANIDALEAATAGVISGAPGTSDTVLPTVSLTAPANGATVSGSAVTVSANASDNVGVARVQFRLDGANLGAAVTTPPYSISWNTTTRTNGSHTLTAQAFDAAGNMGSSAPVTVTVANDTTLPTVAISSPTAGLTASGVVTITASAADNVGVTRIDYLLDGQVLGVLSPAVLTFAWNTATVSNGSHSLSARAYDAAGNIGTSATVPVTVSNLNPAPTLSTLSPSSGAAGGTGFTLTVTGGNFIASSVVQWNGAARPTTFVSSTQLTAAIAAADIAAAGTASVTVFNPMPGGGISAALTLAINNSAPTLGSLSPSNATTGGAGVTLTVTGSNFVAASMVRWNGADRITTFVSGSQLTATIAAPDIAGAGTASVTVLNPAPGGGTSGALTFTINTTNPVPTVSSLSPGSAVAGGAGFILTVNGSNFVAASVVRWNGANRTTTFVSGAQLTAAIPASDLATAGTAQVTVFTPAPGGGTSPALAVPVNSPVRSPYKGVPFPVPGLIEAEDFDTGGEGVSWHDLTSGNQGGFYRSNTDVDIIAPTGNANGGVVNNFQTGEWLEYTISVAKTGTYRLEANASSEFSTSRWHAEIDGVNVTGSVAVPNTGWWGTFQWIGVGGISLSAGQHVLRIYADQEYFNLDALRILAAGDTTLPTVSITAPSAGATVLGIVTVAASASDNVGVVAVQFKLDSANLGAEVTTAPYSTAWDTSTASSGSHSLTAVARDAAGNTATATAVTVTVSNITSGLVAAYSFNQGSGGTALDIAGNGNNGTISGATWTSQGRYGNGLSFDGVSNLVRASNVTLGAAFTIMAWIYNPTNAQYETIVTVGTNRDFYLRSGVISFYDGSTERPFGSAISRNVWHHVAVVSDGSTLRVYLDGAPRGTPQALSLGSITGVLQVGAWTLGSANYDFFGGRIDEVRVYSRALTQAEVQSNMNTPIVP